MADKCPKCGANPTKGPNCEWTPFFACDSVGEPPCFRQSERCRIRELETALLKLWKHTPKIDNGHCAVCRIGYASWLPDGKGGMKVCPCDRADCLSHVITAALAKEGT